MAYEGMGCGMKVWEGLVYGVWGVKEWTWNQKDEKGMVCEGPGSKTGGAGEVRRQEGS